jgi:hypothetical protein
MFTGGSIGNNFDALTFAAPNAAAQGEDLFYYLRQDLTGNSVFGFINPDAPAAATAATDLFNLGKKIDYMTFSATEVGYGADNQFYYLRSDTNGNTVFGTINALPSFTGTPAERAVDRFTLTGHFQELEFTPTDVGYGANLFYSIRGGDILTTNTVTTYETNTVTTYETNTVFTFTTNSVVSFTPTNTVTATGMDICLARTVAAAANCGCLGPLAQAPLAPAIAASTTVNRFLSRSFPSENGKSYTVQYKNSMNDPTWTDLETVIGTGGNLPVTDPTAGQQPSRFYRVIMSTP